MNKIVEKALEILGVILLIPGLLIFLLLGLAHGADVDLERASDKELVAFSLLAYGLVFVFVLLNALPSLYLPPNLAIVALFLGIGGPLILVGYIVVYAKMKKKKEKRAVVAWEETLEDQTASELGYGLMELKEQLGRSDINLEEYERKKECLERLTELKLQLGRGDITFDEYYRKKKKLLEKPKT